MKDHGVMDVLFGILVICLITIALCNLFMGCAVHLDHLLR